MTRRPSEDGSSSGNDLEQYGPNIANTDTEATADPADIAALLSSNTSNPSIGMTMATLAVAASIGNGNTGRDDVQADTHGDRESGVPTNLHSDRESGAPTDNHGDRESGVPTNTHGASESSAPTDIYGTG